MVGDELVEEDGRVLEDDDTDEDDEIDLRDLQDESREIGPSPSKCELTC